MIWINIICIIFLIMLGIYLNLDIILQPLPQKGRGLFLLCSKNKIDHDEYSKNERCKV